MSYRRLHVSAVPIDSDECRQFRAIQFKNYEMPAWFNRTYVIEIGESRFLAAVPVHHPRNAIRTDAQNLAVEGFRYFKSWRLIERYLFGIGQICRFSNPNIRRDCFGCRGHDSAVLGHDQSTAISGQVMRQLFPLRARG